MNQPLDVREKSLATWLCCSKVKRSDCLERRHQGHHTHRLALPRTWGILFSLESAPEFRIKLITACFSNILKMHIFHKTLGTSFHTCACFASARHPCALGVNTIAWSHQVILGRVRQSAVQFSHRCECGNNPMCNQKSQDSKGNYRFWKETWLGLCQKLGSRGRNGHQFCGVCFS